MRCWFLCTAFLSILLAPTAVAGQPPVPAGEMCGDGTSFEVPLFGLPGSLPFGHHAPPDVVRLPMGCDIYAFFVSGYSVNPLLNYLSFYKLAQHVATRNGYVHYSWWNNFMGEYLSRPLHTDGVPLALLPTPGGATHPLGFVPADFGDSATFKAVPEEDGQFLSDARRVLQEVRRLNPGALIIVAGHSMGGNAVARLGAIPDVPIDLLAPIDPVGNRSSPVGVLPVLFQPGVPRTFNWNRWRVANDLRGYKQVDCVRNNVGLCRDFDDRPLHVSFRCEAVGPVLVAPPALRSLSPLCARAEPYLVMGPRPSIGNNVRILYHRWQKEFAFPFDFDENAQLYRGGRPRTGLPGDNYQEPLLKNGPAESDPNKSCGVSGGFNQALLIAQLLMPGFVLPVPVPQPGDPRDPGIHCSPFDGHGEIVGLRGALTPYGVQARSWPCYLGVRASDAADDCTGPDGRTPGEEEVRAGLRRERLISLAHDSRPPHPGLKISGEPDDPGDLYGWGHEPANPHLDLVVDDLITIVERLAPVPPDDENEDVTAPVTEAATDPAPNAAGWHSQNVLVDLLSADAGSGVAQIEYSIAGAQPLALTIATGASAQQTITAEGISTLQFRARDEAGNMEALQELVVQLDRTPPAVVAEASREPNAQGWHNSPVTITFRATDSLSGVAAVSDPVTIDTEAAGLEVVGTASDVAGNDGGGTAMLSIDRTPPSIDLQIPPVVVLNANIPAIYTCGDALSGISSCVGTVPAGAPIDATSVGTKAFAVHATDHADHTMSLTGSYSVHYAFSGFQGPLSGAASPFAARAGRVIPIQYALYDATGVPISDLASFTALESSAATCDGSASEETVAAAPAGSSGAQMRFDGETGLFTFNWKTSRDWSGTCRMLRLTLNDGAEHSALIRFR